MTVDELKKELRTLDTDKLVKHYSEMENLVDETLDKMGIELPKEDINSRVLDYYSFTDLKKPYGMKSETAFILIGESHKKSHGKLYNIFLKENPLNKIFPSTFHELGHVDYYQCIYNSARKYDKEISEVFAISFKNYGLESFNTLNYNFRYNIRGKKNPFRKYKGNTVYIKIIKGLIDKFPNMKELYFFLRKSTDKEILKKSKTLRIHQPI
ncbi:MAG: hypothetical protein ISS23_00130 [Nanoarchaeota archaeon]|nr:hypothetical protein [Nanoarchaeota archaeon]